MKYFFILIVFLLLSGTANAEWTLIARTEKVDFYVDYTTNVKSSDKAKMWSLQDLKRGLMFGDRLVLSTKDYQEYDCKNKTRRLIKSVLHSDQMGQGEVVMNFNLSPNDQKDDPVVPDGAGSALWENACTK